MNLELGLWSFRFFVEFRFFLCYFAIEGCRFGWQGGKYGRG